MGFFPSPQNFKKNVQAASIYEYISAFLGNYNTPRTFVRRKRIALGKHNVRLNMPQ